MNAGSTLARACGRRNWRSSRWSTPLPGEFELIARYCAPLAAGEARAFDLTDEVPVVDIVQTSSWW